MREEKVLPLEVAIEKMTSVAARRVGLRDRGLIKEGNFADLTLFDPGRVSDRATFENPHQFPVGIEYVLVNGRLELEHGEQNATLAGQPLRGPGYKP